MLLTALNDNNALIDWWFMYKLPSRTGSAPADGSTYLYYDAKTIGDISLSPKTLDLGTSALDNTLYELFDSKNPNVGYILYNDIKPAKNAKNNTEKGRTKGVLAFNKQTDSGFLLTHSTPGFPFGGEAELPEKEYKNGQSFLCITLKDFATTNKIADHLRYLQDPQVYLSRIPDNIDENEPLNLLASEVKTKSRKSTGTLIFKSREEKTFQLISQNGRWKKDFWLDLVRPTLNADFIVESWITRNVPSGRLQNRELNNIQYLNFKNLKLPKMKWKHTRDRANWAVSFDEMQPWVCIGDVDRMLPEEQRGRGTIAFQEPRLWKNLRAGQNTKIQP